MNDPVIARFAQACGAHAPLDLRVDLADGGVLDEGSVAMPFALIGRDDACDVTLTDSEVNPRHAWLQVIAGRVYAVDLGSRTGLVWPDGRTGNGWVDPATPVRVGPFLVRLRAPASPSPAALPAGYNPLQSDPGCLKSRPAVTLEFRNGRRARDRWTVNRLVTLVGRAPECKIHLTADDIAGYHCGLVLTPDGLWVVDLSARGVVVNGERLRVSPLPHGAELWVGRFLIGVQYHGVGQTSRPSVPAPPAAAAVPEDTVPIGREPLPDSDGEMSSSHIMADAFGCWSPEAGAESHPIAVGSSGRSVRPAVSAAPTPSPALLEHLVPEPGEAAALLRQLGEIHTQLFAQFQNSLVLMVRLFGCLRHEELPVMQRELARIQELNAELAQLQAEVNRRATEAVAAPAPKAGPVAPPSAANPPPSDSTALHDWVMGRVNSLQRERQQRWQSLIGLLAEKPA
ncbi:MAG TPA: FHA domain-containing protein [Gemmata sp.]|nr:FHA domain-containing protein [Gemmata sp.]